MSSVSEFGPALKITRDRWEKMIEAGIIGEDEHLELLDGVIVEMSPMSPRHAEAIRRLTDFLQGITFPLGLGVYNQIPVNGGALSLPEPDVLVAKRLDSSDDHLEGRDIPLAVEVSVTSLPADRRKALIYAQAGIPEYWIVDVDRRCLEVYRDPQNREYTSIRRLPDTADIAPLFAPDSSTAVLNLLPRK